MRSKGKIYKIIANLVKKKTLKMLSWTCYIWSKCHTYSMAGLKAWRFDPPQPLMDGINSKGHISQWMVMWCDTGCPEGRPISCWQEQRCIAASGLRSEAESETWGNRERKTCWCWELRRRQGGWLRLKSWTLGTYEHTIQQGKWSRHVQSNDWHCFTCIYIYIYIAIHTSKHAPVNQSCGQILVLWREKLN